MSHLFDDNSGRDWKKIGYHGRSAFAVLLSLAVLLGGAIYGGVKVNHAWTSYKSASDYPGPGVKDIQVTIPAGATGSAIGTLLADKDVVKSKKAFLKAYDANSKANQIQAGTYKLKTQLPASTAVDMLLDKANQVHNLLTVPEGMWLSDQLVLISKRTGIPLADFQKAVKNPQALGLPEYVGDSAEGFLYPTTYEIGQKPTATSILKQMAAQYNKVAAQLDLEANAKKLNHDPKEIMVIASILQAEAKQKDMPMVSGIIENRLDKKMSLQLDSTSHYQLKIPMNKPLPSGFQDKDPYNTYNTWHGTGLPDGPIDAPGEPAIKAALNPKKSDYLFWLTVNFDTGETKYAKTNAEQNQHMNEWKAWCKTAKNKSGCPA